MMPSYPQVVPNNQQVVIPQITFPSMPTIPSIQGPQLTRVKGMDGAKRFPTTANAMYALFDEDDDVMYIKVTDQNNYPVSLKRYRFVEEEETVPASPEYVTKDDYNVLCDEVKKLKEELQNAKQPVQKQSGNAYNGNNSHNGK